MCFYWFQSLPAPVKRRLKALKKIQLESTKIEAKFYEEVHKLECKYHELYKPLYEQRVKITKGKLRNQILMQIPNCAFVSRKIGFNMFNILFEFFLVGDYEPNDEECEWPSDEEDEDLPEEVKEKMKVEDEKAKKDVEEGKDVKGVPEFWLTIFKNVDMLQEMVQEYDEPVLQKLTDITVTFSEAPMVSNNFDWYFVWLENVEFDLLKKLLSYQKFALSD